MPYMSDEEITALASAERTEYKFRKVMPANLDATYFIVIRYQWTGEHLTPQPEDDVRQSYMLDDGTWVAYQEYEQFDQERTPHMSGLDCVKVRGGSALLDFIEQVLVAPMVIAGVPEQTILSFVSRACG